MQPSELCQQQDQDPQLGIWEDSEAAGTIYWLINLAACISQVVRLSAAQWQVLNAEEAAIQDGLTKLLDIACVSAHERAGWRLSSHEHLPCQLSGCLAPSQDVCSEHSCLFFCRGGQRLIIYDSAH